MRERKLLNCHNVKLVKAAMSPLSLAHLHKTITMMVMRKIRIRTMAPATPPSTGPMMGSDDAVVVVGGDVEPVVEEVSEPVVGPVVVGGSVVGPVVVGPVVVGGAVVGGTVVGGTLGLGVGVTLTCDVVKGSMGVLPLPLAIIEVALGRLVVVVRLGMVVGLGAA